MGIYLSIDLDYWNGKPKQLASRELRWIFKTITLRRIPFHIVDSHEKLLPHTKSFTFNELYNIDYHSDIGDNNYYCYSDCDRPPPLNCGTWVNHIKPSIRKSGSYHWVYPRGVNMLFARCYVRHDPFQKPYCAGWKSVNKRQGKITNIDFDRVVGVGIATSYDWVCKDTIWIYDILSQLLLEFGYNGFRLPEPNDDQKDGDDTSWDQKTIDHIKALAR